MNSKFCIKNLFDLRNTLREETQSSPGTENYLGLYGLLRTQIKGLPPAVSHFWCHLCDILGSSYENIPELNCRAFLFLDMAHQ